MIEASHSTVPVRVKLDPNPVELIVILHPAAQGSSWDERVYAPALRDSSSSRNAMAALTACSADEPSAITRAHALAKTISTQYLVLVVDINSRAECTFDLRGGSIRVEACPSMHSYDLHLGIGLPTERPLLMCFH